MKRKDFTKYSVYILIVVSLSFLLFFIRGNIAGFIVNPFFIENNQSCEGSGCNLNIFNITEIKVYLGSKKTILLPVQNIGEGFLNNCKISSEGIIAPWIYSNSIQRIPSGETINFIFDINIPEDVKLNNYSGKIIVSCDEFNKSQEINLSVLQGLQLINFNNFEEVDNGLLINYSFDNSNIIGENTAIDVWLSDEFGNEIDYITDIFKINRDGPIERIVFLESEGKLEGVYSIYFALSNDLDNFIKQTILLGDTKLSGNVIVDNERGSLIAYGIFLLFIVAGIAYITRSHWKKSARKDKMLRIPED